MGRTSGSAWPDSNGCTCPTRWRSPRSISVGGAPVTASAGGRCSSWGAAGFALASALAGAAPDEATLIVARALQGVAGAFLTTNSLALLRATYGPDSGRAIGLWTSFTSIATVAGPPTGGALVQWVSWRWIFFLNLPLAALTVLLARAGQVSRADACAERQPRCDRGGDCRDRASGP